MKLGELIGFNYTNTCRCSCIKQSYLVVSYGLSKRLRHIEFSLMIYLVWKDVCRYKLHASVGTSYLHFRTCVTRASVSCKVFSAHFAQRYNGIHSFETNWRTILSQTRMSFLFVLPSSVWRRTPCWLISLEIGIFWNERTKYFKYRLLDFWIPLSEHRS